MKKIAVVFGGESSEYSVSLHSAASVIKEIDLNIYQLTLIGITREGDWKKFNGTIEEIDNDTWFLGDTEEVDVRFGKNGGLFVGKDKLDIDVVFPILHGKNGEDGTIQGVFEMAHLNYVGCNVISSAMCLDKEVTHILCENAGIKMAKYVSLKKTDAKDEIIEHVNRSFKYPVFVKPSNVGSSFGITKVKEPKDLEKAIEFAFEYDYKLLIEEGVTGFEIGCAVLGNNEIIIGEVDQVETENDFFDYEGKYNLKNTWIHCPAKISDELKEKAKENARIIYDVMQCSGLARVDIFVDENQELVFNEINTLPGFTSSSRYPTMMKKIGISYTELIAKLYDFAKEKHGK